MANAPLPPQNLEAEEYVLGAMMLAASAIEAVADVLKERDFYRESHGRIYHACLWLYANGQAADVITVTDRLQSLGQLDQVGGKQRIIEIANIAPVASNAAHHARVVRENSIFRDLTTLGTRISEVGWARAGDGQAAIEQAEQAVFDLSQRRHRGDFVSVREVAAETFARLEEQAKTRRDVAGLSTGYQALDREMSGLHPGNLVVIGARPSMGKSALGLGIVANAVIRLDPPVPTALFTLEMNRAEVMDRLLSTEALVESDRLRSPHRLDREDWSRVGAMMSRLQQAPLYIDDSSATTMTEIRSKARRLKLRQPELGLVVVDYIQLMESGGRAENRNIEVSQISRGLKLLAGELGVPVLAISQLSRDVERRHDKRPMLSDLRESGSLEQDADVVLLLYRDEYYFPEETDNQGLAEVQIAKQRNGPTGMRKLSFVKRYTRFSDLPHDGPGLGGV